MNDLGERTIEKYEECRAYDIGSWVQRGDFIYEVALPDWNLLYEKAKYCDPNRAEDVVHLNGSLWYDHTRRDNIGGSAEKPPLGVMPQRIHDRNRRLDILEAISRYFEDEKEIPLEWIDEYNEIISRWQK